MTDHKSNSCGRTTCVARATALLFSAILAASPILAQSSTSLETKASGPKTFYCDDRAGNNQVTVFSETTLEDFTAVCNRVSGQCTIDPKKVESFSGRFAIRVEELDTQIVLRNQHMCSGDWLDSEHFPEIVIQVDKVEELNRSAPTTVALTLVGTCTIRGKSQPIRIPATVSYLDETAETMRRVKGDLLRIRSVDTFPIKLADYGVTGPSAGGSVGLKVAEVVKVKVSVFASTERPADPLKADKPDGPTTRPAPVRPASRPAKTTP